MAQWTAWKVWRRVTGERVEDVFEAIAGTPADDMRAMVIAGDDTVMPPFAWLPFTRDELDALLSCVSAAIPNWQQVETLSVTAIRDVARERYTLLNALRTALAEARWGLMTPEQIAQERVDFDEAVREGLIAGDAVPAEAPRSSGSPPHQR